MKSVEFLLRAPLKYSSGGSFHDEQMLQLMAPNLGSTLTKKNARRLRDLGAQGQIKLQKMAKGLDIEETADKLSDEDREKAKKEFDSGRMYVAQLAMAGCDTGEICDAMKALCPSVVTIGDTEEKFLVEHWNTLDLSDQDELTGVYLQSFLG